MIHKKLMSFIAAGVIAAAFAFTPAAQAQQVKFGTVDMKKVFDGYYKTKLADAQIKDRAQDSEKVYRGMVDDYRKAEDEHRSLANASNDQAAAADERERRKKAAEAKLTDMLEIEKSVKQYQTQARTSLGEQERRLRDSIVKEIRDVVNAKSKSGNYTVVFDTAGQSLYQTPLVLYSVPQFDFTDDVLKELNATAPAGALDAISKPVQTDAVPSILKSGGSVTTTPSTGTKTAPTTKTPPPTKSK